ncbi:hypothetical protein FQN51_009532 [Onygenales sp. PD_10]|nr:hypothetical protein FQN51_009532 [Onygenales sp. PD_10]
MAHPNPNPSPDSEFPYSLTISLPLPTHRLASAALRTLQVDAELSPLVRRTFRLTRPQPAASLSPTQSQSQAATQAHAAPATISQPQLATGQISEIPISNGTEALGLDSTGTPEMGEGGGDDNNDNNDDVDDDDDELKTVLLTEYRATTNRMLRVAVNGFMESLGVVLGVMEELDVDVLAAELGQGVDSG